MPHERRIWHTRIKGVEYEYLATHLGLVRLEAAARSEPAILESVGGLRSLSNAILNVEATYLCRMFAEFENAIQSLWVTIRKNGRRLRAMVLIDRIGSHRKIAPDLIERVHRVREYRNRLVHESESDAGPVSIQDARGFLNKYLATVPEAWG
jgi:hypothetical protein